MTSKKGIVFGVQHFCIHDGPGIRTTVFLKGCPLQCTWCHNPEGISAERFVSLSPRRCIGCGSCFKICAKAHKREGDRHVIHAANCTLCSKCVQNCPGQALEIVGTLMSVDELVGDILRDKRYYDAGEGGLTVSGGEPMMQFGFLRSLLVESKRNNLDVALETSGYAPLERFNEIAPLVDRFLWDYKETDPAKHRKLTGVDNSLILKNLARLNNLNARILLRCPVVPGLNDSDEHFKGIAQWTKRLNNSEGAEIMPYHRLGMSKAARMNVMEQVEFPQPGEETVAGWIRRIEEFGGKVVRH